MTSQDPVASKSHTFQNHHGDVWSRRRLRATRVLRGLTVSCFLAFFQTVPRSFPVSLFLSFFHSFWDGEVSVSFSWLLFLFVLVHRYFCSVVVGFSISQPPFPSSQYHEHVIPLEKYTSMTSADCRVISSSHVQFDEMKVRLWRCYVRIQASDGCKSAFEVAPLLEGSKPTAHRSRDVGGREAGIHAHEWNNKKRRYLIADLKSHVKLAAPFRVNWQGKIAMCMPVWLDVERPLDLRRWDWTQNFPSRHSHREQKRSGDRILGWTAAPSL